MRVACGKDCGDFRDAGRSLARKVGWTADAISALEAVIFRVEESAGEAERQSICRRNDEIDFGAARRLLWSVRKSKTGACEDIGLKILDRLIEDGEIGSAPTLGRFDADLEHFRVFRSCEARSRSKVWGSKPGRPDH